MNQRFKKFQSPIINIYILDKSGIPLFARGYRDSKSQSIDSVLFAGFLSAIELFTKTNLDNPLTDIGMQSSRYFFERSIRGHITVLSAPAHQVLYIDQKQADVIKFILTKVNLAIDVIVITAESHGIDVKILTENFGPSMDSILFESTFEFFDDDKLMDEINYNQLNFEEGQQIDVQKFSKPLNP